MSRGKDRRTLLGVFDIASNTISACTYNNIILSIIYVRRSRMCKFSTMTRMYIFISPSVNGKMHKKMKNYYDRFHGVHAFQNSYGDGDV